MMGCCGDKSRGEAIKDIARAHVNYAVAKITNARPPAEFQPRYDTCRQCEHRTWLSRKERLSWIVGNAGEIAVNPHKIADQTGDLPVNLDQRPGDSLYCRVCRCKCILKARMPDQDCCKGLWPTTND